MAKNDLWPILLGAVQAAVSVLLIIFYGVVTGQYGILDNHSVEQISQLCVKVFLPALLITNVGSELNPENVGKYGLVIVWALLYTLSSVAFSLLLKKVFKLPSWLVPATAFQNATSMPLLLIETLATTGILDSLVYRETDTVAAAVKRAQSYFLANALWANVCVFTIGPKTLESSQHRDTEDASHNHRAEQTRWQQDTAGDDADECTSLFPPSVVEYGSTAGRKIHAISQDKVQRLPAPVRATIDFLGSLVNPPLVGGIIGIIVGLVPPLHRAFFSSTEAGGIFRAWLVTSIAKVGDLFAALQVVIVGVRLSQCLRRMVRGGDSGKVPLTGALTALIVRYFIWPLISIGAIYLVRTRTEWLGDDPVLTFVLMLIPCGPPALNLTVLADVSGASHTEKMSMAKFLTISYVLSPLLSLAVVGSLKATQASMGHTGLP